MKTAFFVLLVGLSISACSVKKTATGTTQASSAVSAKEVTTLLPGRWLVKDVKLAKNSPKPSADIDKTLKEMTERVQGKAYVEFKADGNFVFTAPGVGELDKGTWSAMENGDVTTTNAKGNVHVFTAADLKQGKFTITLEIGGEDKQQIILHFNRVEN